ncbi:unannotated protein [freshwater metagenome]|uniref:Unannotated protein n=1 Tax=freshwater metagenome TaxID=449393 RepID=A0A6J6A0W9_9ZZZZ
MGTYSRAKFVALATVVALAAVACSDDTTSTTTTAPAAAETTVPSAGGDTTIATTAPAPVDGLPTTKGDQKVKVMVLTDVTQGQIAYSAPETYQAVQLAFKNFPNATIDVCDAKGDQNEYLNCQQKAVDGKYNAVVVGWSGGGGAGEDALYEAGIPVLGGQGNTTDPLSYSFASGTGNYVGLGAGSVLAGATKIGVLYLEGTDQLVDAIQKGVEFEKGTVVSRASVPNNAPDLAPAVAKLLGDGAELIILSVSPPMVIQAMTAIKASGKNPKVSAVAAILPQKLLDYMKGDADGIYAISSTLNNVEDSKGMAELLAGVEAIKSGTVLTVQTVLGFEAGYVLATAVASITGDVTADSLKTALDAIDGLDMGGLTGPASTKSLPMKGLERFMNPYAIVYQVVSGKLAKQGDLTAIRGAYT